MPIKFGHIFEIHPIHTNQKGQGYEERRHDGKYFHDTVHLMAHRVEVDIFETHIHLPKGLYIFDVLNRVVQDIP